MKTRTSRSHHRLGLLAALGLGALGLNTVSLADPYHAPGSNGTTPLTGYPVIDPAKKPETPRTPVTFPDIEALRKNIDKSQAVDEALGGKTLHGTVITPRTPECFPAEPRDVMWQMDMVPDKDGKLHPLNFDANNDGKIDDGERNAIRGRNTWVWWGGGNEAFWNWLSQDGYGLNDYVGFLDSRQRDTRFQRSGAVNQPGYKSNSDPSKRILGLYLDDVDNTTPGKHLLTSPPWDKDTKRPYYPDDKEHQDLIRDPAKSASYADRVVAEQSALFQAGDPELFRDTVRKLAELGDGLDYTIYGFPTGVVGLRLFLNPDFFGVGNKAWEARKYWKERVIDTNDRFYTDREIFADTKLVRPFRISMSCGFCHVAPHPLCPPADREHPEWRNLSSNIGNQYWKPATAFGNRQQPNNFLYHFLSSQQPGTVDTSAISTDQINNANTINAVYDILPRLSRAGKPPLAAGQTGNPPEVQSIANAKMYQRLPSALKTIEDPGYTFLNNDKDVLHTPRVLLDGSDSIGAYGALARVYLNIGTFYEQWNRTTNPLIGFTKQRPFSVDTCQRNSVYWQTNEQYRVPYLAAFFTQQNPGSAAPEKPDSPAIAAHTSTQPMKLAEAKDPTGATVSKAAQDYLAIDDAAKRKRGRLVWMDNCAICHSSKQPTGFALNFDMKRQIKGAAWNTQAAPTDNTYTLPADASDWQAFKSSPIYTAYKAELHKLAPDNTLTGDPLTDNHPFWKDNYLSTDIRVPITLVGTNSGRAMATNGIADNVWDNFTSTTYKELPAVGLINYSNPFTGAEAAFEAPGGGRGYYRPATHISLWATAPFLHNNTLGLFRFDPSVSGRLLQFSDSIRRMLWQAHRADRKPQLSKEEWEWLGKLPSEEKPADPITQQTVVIREGDLRGSGSAAAEHDQGFIYRVTVPEAYFEFAPSFAHSFVQGLLGPTKTWILSVGLWLVLVPLLLWLAWKHRPLYVGITLILVAVLVAAGLAVTGIGGAGSTTGVILMAISGLLELSSAQWWLIAVGLGIYGLVFIQARPDDQRAARALFGVLLLGIVYATYRIEVMMDKMSNPFPWVALGLLVIAAFVWYKVRPTLPGFSRAFFLGLAIITAGVGYTANRFVNGEKLFTIPLANITVGPLPLKVGPIPRGTPVNLIMNLDRESPKFAQALVSLVLAMAEIKKQGVTGDAAYEILATKAGQEVLSASKCPDFILDRGHLFGETLDTDPVKNEQAKEDLISFLKTL